MAVSANANKTYDLTTMREDLQAGYTSITPTDTPFQSMIGTRDVHNTYLEWSVVELAAVDAANRVLEGEASPANDAPTNAVRLGNYCQLSDKVAEVTDTANAVTTASDTGDMKKQVFFKMRELKRDIETMLLNPTAAVAGGAAVVPVMAGLPSFIRTNVSRGAGGASSTLSGTTSGYPNAAPTDGTLRALTETMLAGVIAACWDAGAEPTTILCGSGVKQKISQTFTGSSTRQSNLTESKGKVEAAVSVYVSDFGELKIMPTRFIRSRDVFVLDPKKIRMAWLQSISQKDLATTGHASRKLIKGQYSLQVDAEKAQGLIADINPAL